MQSFTAFGDELCDNRVFGCGFEKLKAGVTDRNHHETDHFGWNLFHIAHRNSKQVIDRFSGLQRFNRYAEMVKSEVHWLPVLFIQTRQVSGPACLFVIGHPACLSASLIWP